MNNQIFNWNRFTLALRKEVVENKRLLMLGALGIYAVLSLIMIIGNLFFGLEGSVGIHYVVVFIIFSIGLIISASLTFRQLKTKVGRIEYFTSPSSTLEKFLVNAAIYVLGFVLVFFACAQLADLTRWGMMSCLFSSELLPHVVPGPINFLGMVHGFVNLVAGNGMLGPEWLEITIWIGMVASAGLYAMGSALWPKWSFLKTYGALYGIETVLGFAMMICVPSSGWEAITDWIHNAVMDGAFFIWFAAFAVLQAVVFWALAWYLFKHKDVVSLKWWK